jgi:hypothetical protein
MKNTTKQIGIIAIVALSFGLVDSIATSLYWRHLAIKHSAAFYETNSWGIPSFKWNDVSFAQAPFQDGTYYSKKMEEAESKRIRSLGIK